MNAAAEIINEMYLRHVRTLPDDVLREVFGLSQEMIDSIKSLNDNQLRKLITTNQFLITLKDNIL